MSDASQEIRRICWSSCFPFLNLFRSFRQTFNVAVLGFVFCGIASTYLAGRVMDWVWPNGSQPVVVSGGGQSISELEQFIVQGRGAAKAWVDEQVKDQSAKRVGVFELMFNHVRTTANGVTAGVFALSPRAIGGSAGVGVAGVAWMFAMHPVFAVLWSAIFLVIWGYCGGAASRVLALAATKDEGIGIKEAGQFARKKLVSFVLGPILPFAAVGLIGLLQLALGAVGCVPWLELVVGILYFLSIIGGLLMAFLMIGGVAGFSLAMPTVAVEGSDAFDSFTRSFAYVYTRPWKAAFYGLVAASYGAICVWFVKLFVQVALWASYSAVGLPMNAVNASVGDPATDQPKLEAIWQGPSLFGDTTFIGGFEAYDVNGMPSAARFFFRLWIYGLYGLVAAVAVSLYLALSTNIYLLLRREVDATDLEEVFTESIEEISPAGGAAKPSEGAAEGGGDKKGDSLASLPVVGQSGG